MDPRDFTTAEIAAAADDVSTTPLRAVATPEGDVHVIVDAATARYLATAWAQFHATPPMSTYRPGWPADVIQLITAAAHADMGAGRVYVIRRGFTVHPIPGALS